MQQPTWVLLNPLLGLSLHSEVCTCHSGNIFSRHCPFLKLFWAHLHIYASCKKPPQKTSCQIGFMFSPQLRAFFLTPPQHIQILSNKNIAGCRFSTYTRYICILENLLAEPMWFYSIIAKRCECNSTILSKSQDCSLATLKVDLI